MAATANRGYTYPTSSGSAQLWTHFQNLATSIDTDVAALVAKTTAKPLCVLVDSTAQSMTHGTDVAITFESELVDTHNWHSTSSNTSRITPNIAGYYRISGLFAVASRSGGFTTMSATIAKSGTAARIVRQDMGSAGSGSRSVFVSTVLDANGTTDYFELWGQQTNSGSVAVSSSIAAPFVSTLEVEFIR